MTEILFEQSASYQTEIVDHRQIGRFVCRVNCDFESTGLADQITEVLIDSKSVRDAVSAQMHGNSPSKNRLVPVARGVSSYFSWNPETDLLTVEWGRINPNNGEAKLHTFLNRSINFVQRSKEGMTIRSGHMARSGGVVICLIDSLCELDSQLTSKFPEYRIVEALTSNGAVVIGTDGYPISVKKSIAEEVVSNGRTSR